MGNAAGSMEFPMGKEGKTVSFPPGSETPQKQEVGPKIPMPAEEELDERFNVVLVSPRPPHPPTHTHTVYGACEGTHSLLHSPKQKPNTKKQRMLNILKMCTSPGQAYQRAGYIM